MKMFQIYKKATFKIWSEDKVINGMTLRPVLTELRKRLEAFTFKENSFKAWVESVMMFTPTYPEPSTAEVIVSLNIEARDTQQSGTAHRYNQFQVSVLNNRLSEQIHFETNGINVKMMT